MEGSNILDADNFLKRNLSEKDKEQVIFLRQAEKQYQKVVNRGRNAIYFMAASFLVSSLSFLRLFSQYISEPRDYMFVAYDVLFVIVFVVIGYHTTRRPRRLLTTALALILVEFMLQYFVFGEMSSVGLRFIIIFFIGQGIMNAQKLLFVREKLISFGEEPTF